MNERVIPIHRGITQTVKPGMIDLQDYERRLPQAVGLLLAIGISFCLYALIGFVVGFVIFTVGPLLARVIQ